MTQNLNHYEKILSRSHSNYLAQISIEMTDANNQINDVLSKLTALGTVLIPMNLVTGATLVVCCIEITIDCLAGIWGMNVHVPGQDIQVVRELCDCDAWFSNRFCTGLYVVFLYYRNLGLFRCHWFLHYV